jgi:hypothetical protein
MELWIDAMASDALLSQLANTVIQVEGGRAILEQHNPITWRTLFHQ